MLRVVITLEPGGDKRRSRVLHEIEIANVSGLADVSDYSAHEVVGDGRHMMILGHARSDGALALTERVLRTLTLAPPALKETT